MTNNKGLVTGSIPATTLSIILTALATVREHLGFLIALSPDQRKTLFKMGTRSLEFVTQVRDVVASNADLVPKAMEPEEFLSDVALIEAINRILTDLLPMVEAMEDTRMAAGSDAMTSATSIYGVLQSSRKAVPGLDEVVKKLAKRFRRSGVAADVTDTEAPAEPAA